MRKDLSLAVKLSLAILLFVRPVPCVCAALAEAVNPQSLIQTGDKHDSKFETQAALTDYLDAAKSITNNADLYWRIAKEYIDSMDTASADLQKKSLALSALDYATRAVSLASNNAKAHIFRAIAYGRASNFVDNKTRVLYSREVRDEALLAIKTDPGDDLGYFVLARWNYEVASFNSVLKVIVKVVYGELPDASYSDAITNYHKAIKLAPGRLMHHYHLGRAYEITNHKSDAVIEYRQVLTMPPTLHDDFELKAKAKAGLLRLNAQ
jgi:tetratricopeptide (TPR) repeat protein